MSKLLTETFDLKSTPEQIKESFETGGPIILRGVLQKADCENQNKRIYPERILRRECENFAKVIRENRALGELNHPTDSAVNLNNVSHVIRKLWWEGKNVMGEVELLNTAPGKTAITLFQSGITLGISSRGVGSTSKNENGLDVVSEDFQLVTWDLVAEPSTPGAFLHENVKLNHKFSKADRIYRALNDILVK